MPITLFIAFPLPLGAAVMVVAAVGLLSRFPSRPPDEKEELVLLPVLVVAADVFAPLSWIHQNLLRGLQKWL